MRVEDGDPDPNDVDPTRRVRDEKSVTPDNSRTDAKPDAKLQGGGFSVPDGQDPDESSAARVTEPPEIASFDERFAAAKDLHDLHELGQAQLTFEGSPERAGLCHGLYRD